MFFQSCIILPVVEEQGRTCGGQAKVEALRINLNVEGCGIVVAAPVQASSHAPLFLSLQIVKNMMRLL